MPDCGDTCIKVKQSCMEKHTKAQHINTVWLLMKKCLKKIKVHTFIFWLKMFFLMLFFFNTLIVPQFCFGKAPVNRGIWVRPTMFDHNTSSVNYLGKKSGVRFLYQEWASRVLLSTNLHPLISTSSLLLSLCSYSVFYQWDQRGHHITLANMSVLIVALFLAFKERIVQNKLGPLFLKHTKKRPTFSSSRYCASISRQ